MADVRVHRVREVERRRAGDVKSLPAGVNTYTSSENRSTRSDSLNSMGSRASVCQSSSWLTHAIGAASLAARSPLDL
ncbi:MAG: hypothetical protein ACHQEA_09765 [Gaiellales bacterium]